MGISSLEKEFQTPPLDRSHRLYKSFQISNRLRFW